MSFARAWDPARPIQTDPFDRFPCSYPSRFVSIGSNRLLPHQSPHEFTSALHQALVTPDFLSTLAESASISQKASDGSESPPAPVLTREVKCEKTEGTKTSIRNKLNRLFGPHGHKPLLGNVPIRVHALRVSTNCIRISGSPVSVLRTEFVVHRHSDTHAIHYLCLVGREPPHEIFAYKEVGLIAEDALWSTEHDQPHSGSM